MGTGYGFSDGKCYSSVRNPDREKNMKYCEIIIYTILISYLILALFSDTQSSYLNDVNHLLSNVLLIQCIILTHMLC